MCGWLLVDKRGIKYQVKHFELAQIVQTAQLVSFNFMTVWKLDIAPKWIYGLLNIKMVVLVVQPFEKMEL